MEIVRADLLLYFTFLSLISCSLSYILKPLWSLLFRPIPEEFALRDQMRQLRKEQNKLSIKDEFAAHSRLQRKINGFEDKLKELASSRSGKNTQLKYGITFASHIVMVIIMLVSSIYHRGVPLVTFDQSLFPFERFFGYPSDVPNCIVPHSWMIISRVSISMMLGAITKLIDTKNDPGIHGTKVK